MRKNIQINESPRKMINKVFFILIYNHIMILFKVATTYP